MAARLAIKKKKLKPTKRGKRPYAASWFGHNGIAAKTCNMTRRICIWCMVRKATLSHHFYYRNCLGQKIYGKEISGISCGGVCPECHGILHSKGFWQYSDDPDGDHNTPEVIFQLRFNFWFLFLFLRFSELLLLMFIGCIVFLLLGVL